jgi:hypothetical protein
VPTLPPVTYLKSNYFSSNKRKSPPYKHLKSCLLKLEFLQK